MTFRVSVPAKGGKRSPSPENEAAVRTYLRVLVGSPVRSTDRLRTSEAAFVRAVPDWSDKRGVDKRTLVAMGVPRRVLDATGIAPTPVGERIRRHYGKAPFTVADLVRKSGASVASVRSVIADDVRAGRLKRIANDGRTVLYGMRK
jgi:hypothetical protein